MLTGLAWPAGVECGHVRGTRVACGERAGALLRAACLLEQDSLRPAPNERPGLHRHDCPLGPLGPGTRAHHYLRRHAYNTSSHALDQYICLQPLNPKGDRLCRRPHYHPLPTSNQQPPTACPTMCATRLPRAPWLCAGGILGDHSLLGHGCGHTPPAAAAGATAGGTAVAAGAPADPGAEHFVLRGCLPPRAAPTAVGAGSSGPLLL